MKKFFLYFFCDYSLSLYNATTLLLYTSIIAGVDEVLDAGFDVVPSFDKGHVAYLVEEEYLGMAGNHGL